MKKKFHTFLLNSRRAKQNNRKYDEIADDKTIYQIIQYYLKKYGEDADLNGIDVSQVTDMSNIFYVTDFQGDVSEWDVSGVTNFSGMFGGCKRFNCDLSGWDVHSGITFNSMFSGCERFNSDIGNWEMGSATSINSMFLNCYAFDKDLTKWDIQEVEDMDNAFCKCFSFKGKGLDHWKPIKVKKIAYAFYWCKSFNTDLSSWKIKLDGDMSDSAAWYEGNEFLKRPKNRPELLI